MIAIEFDKVYAVSHPGRSRLFGFGLFCGSNGYWRADLLRAHKMHGDMLTEDIDSALRAYVPSSIDYYLVEIVLTFQKLWTRSQSCT